MLEINQSEWLKPYVGINTKKRIEVEKKCQSIAQINDQSHIWKRNGKLEN